MVFGDFQERKYLKPETEILFWQTGGEKKFIFRTQVFSLDNGEMTLTLCFILLFQACSDFASQT